MRAEGISGEIAMTAAEGKRGVVRSVGCVRSDVLLEGAAALVRRVVVV